MRRQRCSVHCWRGKEIKRTAFEIAITDDTLNREEMKNLLSKP